MDKIRKAKNLIPCLILIAFVMGVMFTGYATATEAAAFGVLGSLAIAWWSRSLTRQNFWESLIGATRLSCMILFILAGAAFLSSCMAFTGIPRELAAWVASLDASPLVLIGVLAVIYLLLGMAIDGISMIVLTTSIVLPMIEAAGFDLIWFGIFIVLLVEIAQITPPVGFNLFVLQTMTGRDSNYVALASIPFFLAMLAAIAVIVAFPQIATWLPEVVIGATRS
jgi:tripartite ATP-independent transporter DctM subunit